MSLLPTFWEPQQIVVTIHAELMAHGVGRCVVYRDRSAEYHLAPDRRTLVYTDCDIVAAGSPKAMEAVLHLMRSLVR